MSVDLDVLKNQKVACKVKICNGLKGKPANRIFLLFVKSTRIVVFQNLVGCFLLVFFGGGGVLGAKSSLLQNKQHQMHFFPLCFTIGVSLKINIGKNLSIL